MYRVGTFQSCGESVKARSTVPSDAVPPIFAGCYKIYQRASAISDDAANPEAVKGSDITIVVPTYERGEILPRTLQKLLCLSPAAASIILVDQTPKHHSFIEQYLAELLRANRIRWIRIRRASQPVAMNVGLLCARTRYVLFLDDDAIPCSDIIAQYVEALNYARKAVPSCSCVAGQIIQPNQRPVRIEESKHFPLSGDQRYLIDHAGAGNMCVNRATALSIGGLDENFVGTAYRADADFARRLVESGHAVLFEPRATVDHLACPTGGIRAYGNWQKTWKPYFAVGSYYYYFCWRELPADEPPVWLLPLRSIFSRHVACHPWLIPAVLVSNFLAIRWASELRGRGRQLIDTAALRWCAFAIQSGRTGRQVISV